MDFSIRPRTLFSDDDQPQNEAEEASPPSIQRVRRLGRSLFSGDETPGLEIASPNPVVSEDTRKRKREEPKPPFTGLIESFSTAFKPLQSLFEGTLSQYTAPSGKVYDVAKQPSTSKTSCGAGAIAMVGLRLLREGKISEEAFSSEVYRTSHKSATLLQADTIQQRLQVFFQKPSTIVKHSLIERTQHGSLTIQKVSSREEVVGNIKKLLDNNIIIQAITHPYLEGHWILINEYDETSNSFVISDPYSGNGYLIPEAELTPMIFEDDLPNEYSVVIPH